MKRKLLKKTLLKKIFKKKALKNLNYILLIILLFLLIFVIVFFIKPINSITGGAASAVSTTGNVEEINVSLTKSSGYWQAFYGEISEDSSVDQTPSAVAQGGSATEFNAAFSCIGEEIYASVRNILDFEDVSAGARGALDHYLQLNSSHLESGSRVFANTKTFTVGSSAIADVPATYTKVPGSPGNTTFDLGLLNFSNSLILVSHISLDTKGFDNKTHDYQMMVPVNGSPVIYYFFSDCEVTVPTSLPVSVSSGGGGAPVEKKALPEISLKLSEEFVKAAVYEGESLEKKIRVINDGKADLFIKITTALSDLLVISPSEFSLLPGREQEVAFIFNPYLKIKSGIYTRTILFLGENKLRSMSKATHVVLEVKSKEALLDVSLDLPKKTYFPGEELKAIITLLNLKKTYPANVTLIHLIMDMNNNIIYSEEEIVTVWNQASFSKTILLSQNIPVGQYLYALKGVYVGSFATASEFFMVVEPAPKPSEALIGMAALMDKRTFYFFGIPVLLLLVVITIFLIVYLLILRKGKIKKKNKMKKV